MSTTTDHGTKVEDSSPELAAQVQQNPLEITRQYLEFMDGTYTATMDDRPRPYHHDW